MALHQQVDWVSPDCLDWDIPRLARSQWDGGLSPDVNVSESDRHYEVSEELPEFDHGGVNVSLIDGVLMINGKKRSVARVDDGERNFVRLQQVCGSFRRYLQYPPRKP